MIKPRRVARNYASTISRLMNSQDIRNVTVTADDMQVWVVASMGNYPAVKAALAANGYQFTETRNSDRARGVAVTFSVTQRLISR